MRSGACAILLAAVLAPQASAASFTLSGLLDGEDGRVLDLDARVPVTDNWSVGGGFGHGESSLGTEKFSASSLRLSTDLQFGGLFVSADAERWKDSGQLRSTMLRGEAGWMSESGFAISALVADRNLDIGYTATILGQTREFQANLDGTGFGGDLSYLGEKWSVGLRFTAYDYGRNVDRVRNIRDAAETGRFPRLQRLIASVATRAAGAPDREIAAIVSRQFPRHYVSSDWQMQRDAVTGDETHSLGVTLGFELGEHFVLDTMAGISDSDRTGSVGWGGIALTLRTSPTY
jgi:hypothetical protein